MRKLIVTIVFIFSAVLVKAQYQQSIGIALGYPSGFSYKFFQGDNSAAIDLTLGWTPRILLITGMYEFHNPLADQFTWYYGPGVHLGISNNDPAHRDGTLLLGADGTIGIEFKPEIPVVFSVDFRPRLDFIGEFGLKPQAQIGIRYILR